MNERLLTTKDLAVVLGCSTKAVYARLAAGTIPQAAVVHLGRSLRFLPAVVDTWLTGGGTPLPPSPGSEEQPQAAV